MSIVYRNVYSAKMKTIAAGLTRDGSGSTSSGCQVPIGAALPLSDKNGKKRRLPPMQQQHQPRVQHTNVADVAPHNVHGHSRNEHHHNNQEQHWQLLQQQKESGYHSGTANMVFSAFEQQQQQLPCAEKPFYHEAEVFLKNTINIFWHQKGI